MRRALTLTGLLALCACQQPPPSGEGDPPLLEEALPLAGNNPAPVSPPAPDPAAPDPRLQSQLDDLSNQLRTTRARLDTAEQEVRRANARAEQAYQKALEPCLVHGIC